MAVETYVQLELLHMWVKILVGYRLWVRKKKVKVVDVMGDVADRRNYYDRGKK
jgi:hypothetical protein